ncbi:hypothetical protein MGA447_0411 [Enterococcus faecalis]|nr:hypothetical protein ELS84_0160 [Enterococcus faecalis]OSH20664.1 hypothetical protein MGA447_0411 [Enterococcus faecalis]OSH22849.1 hypothetical protein NM154_0584 [Enterococcus faecalis]OSH31463.1 hypothetical protein EFQH95_0289 [Enterococcus faecalis]OSH46757.1 hypothetical protein YM392_0822 [Enterococcus faecalis]
MLGKAKTAEKVMSINATEPNRSRECVAILLHPLFIKLISTHTL